MVTEHKELAAREAEQTRLNTFMATLEVSLGDLEEELTTLVGNDDTFRATQFPVGSSRYKSFANKVAREQTELQKLIQDIQNEEGKVDLRRTQLYIDTIA